MRIFERHIYEKGQALEIKVPLGNFDVLLLINFRKKKEFFKAF